MRTVWSSSYSGTGFRTGAAWSAWYGSLSTFVISIILSIDSEESCAHRYNVISIGGKKCLYSILNVDINCSTFVLCDRCLDVHVQWHTVWSSSYSALYTRGRNAFFLITVIGTNNSCGYYNC